MSDNNGDESLPWKQIVAKSVHDMRSPLSCMRTTLEILRMTSGGAEPQTKLVGIMDTQIDELTAQLDMLLKNPAEIVHLAMPSSEISGH
jgi:K+-sensing histidine kinase KdpD